MTVKRRIDVEHRLKGAKKAEKQLHALGGSIQSTIMKYASAGIAITAVTRLISKSVEAYGIQELAEKKLQTALGKTSKELLEYASNLQLVSNYGDEAIINVMGLIGAFIKDESQIKAATKATLDFAAATGMDLTSAGQLVAKTLGSTTDALTRYGMKTVGAVGSTERLKSMTEGIAKLWGGQAKAASETFTGSITQMEMAWGDLTEKFGAMIASMSASFPVLETMAESFRLIGEYVENVDFSKMSAASFGFFVGLKLTAEEAKKEIEEVITAEEKQNKLNEEYHQSLLNRLSENEAAYQKYKEGREKAIEQAQILAEHEARYNEEMGLTIEKQIEANIEIENYNLLLEDTGLKLKKVGKIGVETFSTLEKRAEEAGETWKPMAEQFVSPITGAFQQALTDGTNVFQALGDAFKQMLINMVAELMARAAIFGFLSLISGGKVNIGTDFITAGLPGFQHGGSFQVGGSGGADSQVVAFRATPGEKVNISPPGETQGQVINNNFYGTIIGEDRWIKNNLLPKIYKAQGRGH